MLEIQIAVPPQADLAQVPQLVERLCTAEGLRLTLRGRLAAYPGSQHWHFRRGTERGTLEITLWPERRRLWFKVSAGRTGGWIEQSLPRLTEALSKAVRALVVPVAEQHSER